MHVREYLPKRCQEEQAIQAEATAKAASFFQATKLTFSSLNFSLNLKLIDKECVFHLSKHLSRSGQDPANSTHVQKACSVWMARS